MTYESFALKAVSKKLVLMHIEPSQRLIIWTLDSGSTYYRDVDYFTVNLKEDNTALTQATSSSLSSGEWYYDPSIGRLYIRTSDDTNPNTKQIIVDYRLFFANEPINLPYDLNSGSDVYYEGLLKRNSAVIRQLDEEQIGVALESSTNIDLDNTNGHFDSFYDKLIFENKNIYLYSWSPEITLDEKLLLFRGVVQDKAFSPTSVKFRCKDFFHKLRKPVELDLFSTDDGDVADGNLNKPKRRIYGQVDGLQCVGIDNILNGYELTGTISTTLDSTSATGSGTSFLDELSPGDTIIIEQELETFEFNVESIQDDTNLTLGEEASVAVTDETVTISPTRPFRKKNRDWHIAGHKLREPTTTIASATQPNRMVFTDDSDFFAGDLIDIGGEDVFIRRVGSSGVVLETNLQAGTPSAGTAVVKNPVSKAYYGKHEIFINRDWTLTNTTEAILNIEPLAEFNVARERSLEGTFTFSNGSRTVTFTGGNPQAEIQTRDWIKSDDVTHTTWYEVLSVGESEIILRVAYAGSNNTGDAKRKNVDLIEDDTLITVNCIGMERNGVWVKTIPDAVKDMVENDAGITEINTDSFTDSSEKAPFIASYVIPESVGGRTKEVKKAITDLNESIFGSLVNNNDWELVYSVLDPNKPQELIEINNHDIIGDISVKTANKIVRKVNAEYRPFVDRFTGEDSFKYYGYVNDFVDNLIGITEEKDVTLYLYEDDAAEEIAERYALYNSLSQSIVNLRGKLNFATYNLNDKIWLGLDRLYTRFTGSDKRKIGILNKITKDGLFTNISFNDLGNIFNRVMSITPDTANEFTSSTESEKIKNGYIVDDNLEVPDTSSDQEIYSNIIG